jgi:hypothetical protein
LLLTLQFIIEFADGHDDALDVFAVVQVLLGLFVAFFQLDFHGDHLCRISFTACFVWGLEERKGGKKAGSARDKSRPMHHTCMLAFVNPGSLTIVGLQSTT